LKFNIIRELKEILEIFPNMEAFLMATIHLVTAIQNVQVSIETVVPLVPLVEESFGIALTFPSKPSSDQRCTTNIDMMNSVDNSFCAKHDLCSNLIGFMLFNKVRDLS
jgi:hypothetical protein